MLDRISILQSLFDLRIPVSSERGVCQRSTQRGFDLNLIEHILRFSSERYYDVETDRAIAVGKHDEQLVLIPYEQEENTITPITIHVTTRQQIRFRLKTGRFTPNV